MCHGAHCGEGPVLAMLACKCAMRVAPGGSAHPLRSAPWLWMFQAGTGKQALSAELEGWIEGDIPILGSQGTLYFALTQGPRDLPGATKQY